MKESARSQKNSKKIEIQKKLQALQQTGALNFNFFEKQLIDEQLQNQKNKQMQIEKIVVDQEGLQKIFQIIDKNNEAFEDVNEYKLNIFDLKKRIQTINPNFPMQEFSLFTAGKSFITFNEMKELLENNQLPKEMDPLTDAIEQYLDETGNLDFEKIQLIAQQLNQPELTKKDIEILKEGLDIDQDGQISKQDLKSIFEYMKLLKKTQIQN